MASDVFGIVGTTVAGAFRVEAVVAEGGFAIVYRAYHEGFRAPVALKCLKIPGHMSRDEQARFEQQFGAEAELLFTLSAAIPTVVRPLHVEVVTAPDGSVMPFLALEWLEGETLDAVAQRRRREGRPRFSLQELLPALAPVARALERAHHFNGPDGPISIVHRDMKPENIFVARVAGERVIKILDFGIAKAMSVASQVVGRASNGEGAGPFTPAYAAPEQWSPKRFGQTGPWTDVWGFALTLVELLAGHPLIDGDNAAMMGTALDPLRRPTPRSENVAVGDEVEAAFVRALAVDPRERYRDVGEFWKALLSAYNADRAQGDFAARPSGRSGAHALSMSLLPGDRPGNPGLIPDLEIEARPSRQPKPSAGPRPSGVNGNVTLELAREAPPKIELVERAVPDMDAVPISPAPRDPAPTAPSSAPGHGGFRASRPPPAPPPTFEPPSPTADLVARFALSVGMVIGGILITLVDGAYASSSGRVFTVGPIRAGWISGALVLAGIVVALVRFFKTQP